jgi:NAD(P)-dependent dehydrogenase (short-subunit alcohol dehydrogenase family)
MASRTWLITGVSSGFGRELTEQLLDRGDRVVGTVRDTGKVKDLLDHHPQTPRSSTSPTPPPSATSSTTRSPSSATST